MLPSYLNLVVLLPPWPDPASQYSTCPARDIPCCTLPNPFFTLPCLYLQPCAWLPWYYCRAHDSCNSSPRPMYLQHSAVKPPLSSMAPTHSQAHSSALSGVICSLRFLFPMACLKYAFSRCQHL
ncbi:hypothetical protein M430DRAFT_203948 [Amorphotheca resinae ATCC 22711]|uniref:Uncharacterized protein n=1 Tax=Amorphotheca resinae ATCC 22711 TaxID=857342 RepID=A0A2T3BBB9_AMORE|nr:hypothetical protein M430DRAFT_203948 [Amorphotheca resinae ATCC 22711]PSS25564.1 hypothetical protein M430DRAFT_203948 [Amorphotheca resinae ATCC 22711]